MTTNGTRPLVYLTEAMTVTESSVLHTWLGLQMSESTVPFSAVTITDRSLAELAARQLIDLDDRGIGNAVVNR